MHHCVSKKHKNNDFDFDFDNMTKDEAKDFARMLINYFSLICFAVGSCLASCIGGLFYCATHKAKEYQTIVERYEIHIAQPSFVQHSQQVVYQA